MGQLPSRICWRYRLSSLVADTHAALWSLASDDRLSERAKSSMQAAGNGAGHIFVPTITIVESATSLKKPECAQAPRPGSWPLCASTLRASATSHSRSSRPRHRCHSPRARLAAGQRRQADSKFRYSDDLVTVWQITHVLAANPTCHLLSLCSGRCPLSIAPAISRRPRAAARQHCNSQPRSGSLNP